MVLGASGGGEGGVGSVSVGVQGVRCVPSVSDATSGSGGAVENGDDGYGNVDVDISEHGWKEENAGEGRGRSK